MIFLNVPFIVLSYMLGGQVNKIFRPVCVPIVFIISSFELTSLPVLLYGFVLTLGYGVNSKLMKWLKSEQLVRIIYGVFVGLPVIFLVILKGKWYGLFGFPLIVGTSCIRLGRWGKIGNFDILPVDIIRGLVLALVVDYCLI